MTEPPRRASVTPRATVTRLAPTTAVRRARTEGRGDRPFPVQGTLALELGVHAAPGLPETPELSTAGSPRVEHVSDAEVRAWAARLAQAVVETLAGRRPASQLVRWTDPAVHRDLERRARLVREALSSTSRPQVADRLRPQVRSVHVCRPTADAAEVSVHVRHGARSRAVAMRLERRADRWVCTVLQFS